LKKKKIASKLAKETLRKTHAIRVVRSPDEIVELLQTEGVRIMAIVMEGNRPLLDFKGVTYSGKDDTFTINMETSSFCIEAGRVVEIHIS
jgi:hypothetical protein